MKGVRQFKDGRWVTYTQIGGVKTIIYTSDSMNECISAYNEYLNLVRPHKWREGIVDTPTCHDFNKLWTTLSLVGDDKTRKIASVVLERVRTFYQEKKDEDV